MDYSCVCVVSNAMTYFSDSVWKFKNGHHGFLLILLTCRLATTTVQGETTVLDNTVSSALLSNDSSNSTYNVQFSSGLETTPRVDNSTKDSISSQDQRVTSTSTISSPVTSSDDSSAGVQTTALPPADVPPRSSTLQTDSSTWSPGVQLGSEVEQMTSPTIGTASADGPSSVTLDFSATVSLTLDLPTFKLPVAVSKTPSSCNPSHQPVTESIIIEPTPSFIDTDTLSSSLGIEESIIKRIQYSITTASNLQVSSEVHSVGTITQDGFNSPSTSSPHSDGTIHLNSAIPQTDTDSTIQSAPSLKYDMLTDIAPTSPLTLPFSNTNQETWIIVTSQLDLEVTSLQIDSSILVTPVPSTQKTSGNEAVHGRDKKKDWAVPVVVTLAIVVVFLLLIIVMMFLRSRKRQLNNGYLDEDDIHVSSRHQDHRQQHQQQRPHQRKYLTPPRSSVTTFPPYGGDKSNSLPSNASGTRLNPGIGLPKNFSGELNKKSSFDDANLYERIELDRLNGIDTTDGDVRQMQAESRLYDYGYGASNIQNFEKRFHKYIRENSNKNPNLYQAHSSYPVSSAPNGGRTVVREVGVRTSAQHDLSHVEDESRSTSHNSGLKTYPPAKPRRSMQTNSNELKEDEEGDETAYVNKGYVTDNDYENRRDNGEQDQTDNGEDLDSDTNSHVTEEDAETSSDVPNDSSKTSLLGDKRHVISKCVSFDESQLEDNRGKPRALHAASHPVRKVSTVSEPSSEYLMVPEEKRLTGSTSMYDTVDNLSHVDGASAHVSRFFIGSFAEEDRVNLSGPKRNSPTRNADSSHRSRGQDGNFFDNSALVSTRATPSNKEPEQSGQSGQPGQPGTTYSNAKPAFVFPSVSQASKKILEGRKSKKLEPRSSTDGGQRNGAVENTDGRSRHLEGKSSFSITNAKKYSPIVNSIERDHVDLNGSTRPIPKIVLTKDAGELQEDGLATSTATVLNPPRARRIARANNPFLIEVDRSVEPSPTDKVRRSSAPSMASSLDVGVNASARRGMTRSVSGELLGMAARAAAGNSGINPYTIRSWSTEFQNLMTSSSVDDPKSEKRLKQMIDERYNVLFGNKYPDINRMDMRTSPAISPRIVKRRHAAKVKASSLERDGDYTHVMLAHQEEPETDGSTDSPDALVYGYDDIMQVLGETTNKQLTRGKGSHGGTEEHVQQPFDVSKGARPSLQQGTDGCDVEQSTDEYRSLIQGQVSVSGTMSPENETVPNRSAVNFTSLNGGSVRKIPLGKTSWAHVDDETNTSVQRDMKHKVDGSLILNTSSRDTFTYPGSTSGSSSHRKPVIARQENKSMLGVKVSGQSLDSRELGADTSTAKTPMRPTRRTHQIQPSDERRGGHPSKRMDADGVYRGEDPNVMSHDQRRDSGRGTMDNTLTSRHTAVPRYMGARPGPDTETEDKTSARSRLRNYLEKDSNISEGKDSNIPLSVAADRPTPKARQIKLVGARALDESTSSDRFSDKAESQTDLSSSTSSYGDYDDDDSFRQSDGVMEDDYLDSLQSSTV
ncbi:unnamed protein product [Lymnaea stagnalis]|uniref:Uncharacterized protein n=1 Tax=Lymnaea stagnalis TaxID=6523 RepID=A0AAV2HJ03_LYMST